MAHTTSDSGLDKFITAKYSPLLSNAKWVKLMKLLVANHFLFDTCQVKLVQDNVIRNLDVDGNENFGVDYYEDSIEGMVTNPITPGWVLYKEIEWLNFPVVDENALRLKELIDKAGKFRSDLTPDYFRIFGYLTI